MADSSSVLIAQERWLVFGRTPRYDTGTRACLREWALEMQRRVDADADAAKNMLFKKSSVVASTYEGLSVVMRGEGKILPSLDYPAGISQNTTTATPAQLTARANHHATFFQSIIDVCSAGEVAVFYKELQTMKLRRSEPTGPVTMDDVELFSTGLSTFFERKKTAVAQITDKQLADEVIELVVAGVVKSEQKNCRKSLTLTRPDPDTWKEVLGRFSLYIASLRDSRSAHDTFGTPIHSGKRKYPGEQWEHEGASYSRKKGHQGYQHQKGKGGRGGGKYQQGGHGGAPYYSDYSPQWQDGSSYAASHSSYLQCRLCKQWGHKQWDCPDRERYLQDQNGPDNPGGKGPGTGKGKPENKGKGGKGKSDGGKGKSDGKGKSKGKDSSSKGKGKGKY